MVHMPIVVVCYAMMLISNTHIEFSRHSMPETHWIVIVAEYTSTTTLAICANPLCFKKGSKQISLIDNASLLKRTFSLDRVGVHETGMTLSTVTL